MTYQYVKRLIDEEKIRLIEYGEFEQPQDDPGGGNRRRRLRNNKLIDLYLLDNVDNYDESIVTILLTEHPKNIVMCEKIPKIANIRISQIRKRNEIVFSKYDAPEILLSQEIADKKKLNIYSLGFLMWEISNDGVEPFYQNNAVTLALEIIKAEKARIGIPANSHTNKPIIINELALDYDLLVKQMQIKKEFINHFAFNRGRNIKEFDFIRAEGAILYDDGNPKIRKASMDSPIVYIPLSVDSTWDQLNTTGLFAKRDKLRTGFRNNDLQIHVPVFTVEYKATVYDKFIQDIENALKISDSAEKAETLEKHFDYYGNYVVTSFTIGGVITIRDWLNASEDSKAYLKKYIQWAIDYGKGRVAEIFEDVPLDKIPPLDTNGEMDTIGDLYIWFKGLYNNEFGNVISYNKLIPSYRLLPDNLQQELFNITGSQPAKIPDGELIPNAPEKYVKKEFVKFVESVPNFELCLWDLVHNNSLQHGVILHQSSLGHGKKAAFKFLRVPKVTEIKTVTLRLVQPQNRQEAYLLENGIIFKEGDELNLEEIPFAEYSSILSRPLEDFKSAKDQPSHAIYCQIIVNMAKLSFKLTDIKSLQEYSNSVNIAFKSNEPFKNLCKIFGNDYGHLLPRTFTIGGILSKKYISCVKKKLPEGIIQIEYDLNDPKIIENIEYQLAEWKKEFQINTSFSISDNGAIVHRKDIGTWLKDFKEDRNWSVVASEDWTPLFKILQRTSTNIDNTFNQYQIVFNGEELFQKDGQNTFIIRFPGSLIDNNYHIFGAVVKKDENGNWIKYQHPMVSVRFDHQNKSSCAAYIYKNNRFNISKEDTRLLWFVLADPKGYCSNKNRNVRVLYDNLTVNDNLPNIPLKCKNLTSDCVLITTIVSRNDSIFYSIKFKDWSKARISLELARDQAETYEKADNSQTHSWNSFGDYLNSELARLEEDGNEDFDTPPRLTLEKAIEQHKLENGGDLLEAWKTFVSHARRGDRIALYWIGFYLQHDILTASKFFNVRFYEKAIQEFAAIEEFPGRVEANLKTAAMLIYKKSADLGYHEAQLRYAYGLYHGQGVPKNKKSAMHYFKLAALNNNYMAMYNLGITFILGESNDERSEGEKWLIKAAKNGHETSVGFCRTHNIDFS
ncbi:30996_t:CDS:2 [Gigaspora margarita]|uniref:30996_t:CDS:1 n=1 Tax=Gigaspora margarita TaxID=4874 RepID=A0ABN7UUN1_GIGMA|nr:30996_t:CDS:2 [Gigaspora margarita]